MPAPAPARSRQAIDFAASFRLRRVCTALAFTAASALASAQPVFIERLPLIPRTGQGLGTVSTYAGVTPTLARNDAGHDVITLPSTNSREVNLIWTFWNHRLPSPEQWPSGENARSVFTLRTASDTTLTLRLAVRGGPVSELDEGSVFVLKANQPTLIELPLPTLPPAQPVEHLRINFTSLQPIPLLTVMAWSVGESTPAPVTKAALPPDLVPSSEGIYEPRRILVPFTGEGTASNYGAVLPRLEQDAQGHDVVLIPGTGKREVNLVWTYWRHKRPSADQWPSGPAARASLTLHSETGVTLRTRLFVRSSDWSAPVDGPSLHLAAGESQTMQLPLPVPPSGAPIENLRVEFTSEQTIPPLSVRYWSVGDEK